MSVHSYEKIFKLLSFSFNSFYFVGAILHHETHCNASDF